MPATPNSYSVLYGETLYAGLSPPSVALPAWLAGVGVNVWKEITGTAGADNNSLIDAWCGFCITDKAEVIYALSGGHQDGANTQVSKVPLLADAPSWIRVKESLPPEMMNFSLQTWAPYTPQSPGPIFPYCKDGLTPSARHTRYSVQFCKPRNRIMMMGSPALYGANGTAATSNGFSLDTNEWDPPGTWPDLGVASWYGTTTDDLGNIWCRGQKWIQSSNTLIPMAGSFNYSITAFDTKRRKLFMLSKGDGQGSSLNLGIWAKTVTEDGVTAAAITFNPSDAYTEFSGQLLDYSGMEYDAKRDRFLYYYGKGISQGVIYVVTPNNTNVWDISKLEQNPGGTIPGLPHGAGINGRFKYVEALDGVVLLPRASSNLFFMRLG